MGVLLLLGIVLLIVWIVALVVFKVVGFAIHLLLIAAIIAIILHFVRRGANAVNRRV